jgi:hypothetical protein
MAGFSKEFDDADDLSDSARGRPLDGSTVDQNDEPFGFRSPPVNIDDAFGTEFDTLDGGPSSYANQQQQAQHWTMDRSMVYVL